MLRRTTILPCLLLSAWVMTACSDRIATCPVGTVKHKGECIEVGDGGDNGGFSNSDSNGMSNGETNSGESNGASNAGENNGGDNNGMDAGDTAGPIDAGQTDAGLDTGMPMPDAQVDAAPPPCVPSTEICNGVDDDCDGKADEGFLVASDTSTRQWDLAAAMDDATQRGLASVLPRAAGGAWLLFKATAADPVAAPETGASELVAQRVDANNAPVGTPQTGLIPDSRSYLAASYGPYVAAIYHAPDADGDPIDDPGAAVPPDGNGNGATKLVLWKEDAAGLLVQQGDIVTVFPEQTDMSSLSLSETEGGELRILVAYSDASDNTVNATGVAAPFVHAFALNALSQLVEVTAPVSLAGAGATVRIVRRPCGRGWIIGYFDPPTVSAPLADRQVFLRDMSIDGVLGAQTLWSSGLGYSFQGLGVTETCTENAGRLLVILGGASTNVAQELSWSPTSTVTGNQSTVTALADTELPSGPALPAQILSWSGSWFVSLRSTGMLVTGILELDVANDVVRTIELPVALPAMGDPPAKVEPGMASAKHVRDINMYFAPIAGLSNVGNGILVAFSNPTSNPATSPLGAETAAMTYKLSCEP